MWFWLFALHLAATCYMVGLIWFVQLVHYPMMSGAADFVAYERVHQQRTTLAVGPAMLLEMATLLVLLLGGSFGAPWAGLSSDVPIELLGTGLILLIIWVSTALIQVPCHHRLGQGYDHRVHRRLVHSNWIRTIGWSARAVWLLRLLPAVTMA